jgi:hypothetical protein
MGMATTLDHAASFTAVGMCDDVGAGLIHREPHLIDGAVVKTRFLGSVGDEPIDRREAFVSRGKDPCPFLVHRSTNVKRLRPGGGPIYASRLMAGKGLLLEAANCRKDFVVELE